MQSIVKFNSDGSPDCVGQLISSDIQGGDNCLEEGLNISLLVVDCGECDLNLLKLREPRIMDFCKLPCICDVSDSSSFRRGESGWEVNF